MAPASTPEEQALVARDDDFDAAVDEECGELMIRGVAVRPCDALYTDRPAYAEALEQWRLEQRDALDGRVRDASPYPIAHCYSLFRDGAETHNQRLQFLKDTWEAMITIVMALLVCEIRGRGLEVEAGVKREWLQSRTTRERIEVIKCCREYGAGDLAVPDLVGPDAVTHMLALNQRRNEDFSHLGTLNERQSEQLVEEVEPEVVELLGDLDSLGDVELVRPASMTKLETFVGSDSRKTFRVVELSTDQRLAVAERPKSGQEVFALCSDQLFSLSPLVVYRPSERGHRSELAWFKKKKGKGTTREFEYEVFGEAERYSVVDEGLQNDLDQLKRLFVTPPTGRTA